MIITELFLFLSLIMRGETSLCWKICQGQKVLLFMKMGNFSPELLGKYLWFWKLMRLSGKVWYHCADSPQSKGPLLWMGLSLIYVQCQNLCIMQILARLSMGRSTRRSAALWMKDSIIGDTFSLNNGSKLMGDKRKISLEGLKWRRKMYSQPEPWFSFPKDDRLEDWIIGKGFFL